MTPASPCEEMQGEGRGTGFWHAGPYAFPLSPLEYMGLCCVPLTSWQQDQLSTCKLVHCGGDWGGNSS